MSAPYMDESAAVIALLVKTGLVSQEKIDEAISLARITQGMLAAAPAPADYSEDMVKDLLIYGVSVQRVAPEEFYAAPSADAQQEAREFVLEFERWNDETGALPKGGSWMAEIASIIERAYAAVAAPPAAAQQGALTDKQRFDAGEFLLCPHCKSQIPGTHTGLCDKRFSAAAQQGARDDLEYWKQRALDAERLVKDIKAALPAKVIPNGVMGMPPIGSASVTIDPGLSFNATPPIVMQQVALTDDEISLLKDARSAIEEYDAGLENMLGEFSKDVDEYVRGLLVQARALLAHNAGGRDAP